MSSDTKYQNFVEALPEFYKFWEKAKSTEDMSSIDGDLVRSILNLYREKIDPYQAQIALNPIEMLRAMRIRYQNHKMTDICTDIAEFAEWVNLYCDKHGLPDRVTIQ